VHDTNVIFFEEGEKMSYKSKVFVFLTIVCILVIPFTVALAKNEPRNIFPFDNREYTVSSKDEVIIHYGWVTCSKGLVNDYIDAASHVIYFDGALVENVQKSDKSYWDLPYQHEEWLGVFCLWEVDHLWLAYWDYSLGKLQPGDHELVMERTLAFPVIDGQDQDGDGMLDTWQGVTTSTTTIHVLP